MRPDPFDLLGVPAGLSLDAKELEQIYLRLSRDCHPDFHGDADPLKQAEVLSRAADLNHAYRILADPWQRAEALLQRADPTVLPRTKNLDVSFLGEAMDLAEEVAAAAEGNRSDLQERLERLLAEAYETLEEALAAGHIEAAATVLHQARYYRKALADLGRQEHP